MARGFPLNFSQKNKQKTRCGAPSGLTSLPRPFTPFPENDSPENNDRRGKNGSETQSSAELRRTSRSRRGRQGRDSALSLSHPGWLSFARGRLHARSYIHGIVCGRTLPSMAEFLAICDYFGISPALFFDEECETGVLLTRLNKNARDLTEDDLAYLVALAERLGKK